MQRRTSLLASAIAIALASIAIANPASGAASTLRVGYIDHHHGFDTVSQPGAITLGQYPTVSRDTYRECVVDPAAGNEPTSPGNSWRFVKNIGPTGAIAVSRSLITTTSGTWTAIGGTRSRLSVGVEALS